MHAIRLHQFGPAEGLALEQLPDVHPGRGQVRIEVAAAGVHVVDTVLRRGIARGPIPLPSLPTIPGREVAGTVDEVGAGVDGDWIGRRVVAHLGNVPGGYASQAVTAVESLHVLPDGYAERDAVAMVATGRMAVSTAEVAGFGPGDTVLITAAAGGIGSLLVQLAKRAGAFVVGLAGSEAKVRQVLWSGADAAVDYSRDDWADEVRIRLGERPLTVAIDGVGGATGRTSLELLGVGGRFVVIGFVAGNDPTAVTTDDLVTRGIVATAALGARTLQRPGGLRRLETEALALGFDGIVTPLVQAFPLAEAAAAHRAIEARATMGKVVLVP